MTRQPRPISIDSPWNPWQPTANDPWNADKAAFLLRRTCFGPAPDQPKRLGEGTVDAAIDGLFEAHGTTDYKKACEGLSTAALNGGDLNRLTAWWLYQLRYSPQPLLERCTLMWHNLFATSRDKVDDALLLYQQNTMLRDEAIGSFRTMVHGIARDPAMLIYLDSTQNRRSHPNENFARELLELFCLGIGNYTEKDIQELARCFTGWEVRRGRFRFNKFVADTDPRTLFGQTGTFSGEEAVDLVLDHPACATHMARRLIDTFITSADVEQDMIDGLATIVRKWDFEITPILRTVLSSRLFFSSEVRGTLIRSPVELSVGWLRAVNGFAPLEGLAGALRRMGQLPFQPPNVAGWPGGRAWIQSASLAARTNAIIDMIRQCPQFDGKPLSGFLSSRDLSDPEAMVDFLATHVLGIPPINDVREQWIAAVQKAGRKASGESGDRDRWTAATAVAVALPEAHVI